MKGLLGAVAVLALMAGMAAIGWGVMGLFSPVFGSPVRHSQDVPLFFKDGTAGNVNIDSSGQLPKLFFCFDETNKHNLICLTSNKKGKLLWLDIPINPTDKELSI